jgi:hypothetical protein
MSKNKGKVYIQACERSDLVSVKQPSNGSHYKVYGTDENGHTSMMPIPYGNMGDGTECAIKKWLTRMGVILSIAVMIYIFYQLMIVTGI